MPAYLTHMVTSMGTENSYSAFHTITSIDSHKKQKHF